MRASPFISRPRIGKRGYRLKLTHTFWASLGLLCSGLAHANVLNIAPDSVDAQAWIIYDPQTQQTLASHQADTRRAPASLTKMMVAYIALKEVQQGRLALEQLVTVSPVVQQVQADESKMRLQVGTEVSIDTLLAGLTVMSANDAALLLAEKISGSVPAFVARMNQEAQALAMHNTHFQNPPGITMPQHYSTAADLAKLSEAVIQQTPYYLHYSSLPDFHYQQIQHPATNLLLARDASVDGLKTGFTQAAGYNLALSARRPNTDLYSPERRLIVVVLGTPSIAKRAEVAHQLLNVAYTYTQNTSVLQPGQAIAQIPVQKSRYTWFNVHVKNPIVVSTSLYTATMPLNLKQFDRQKQRAYQLVGQQKQWIEPLTQPIELKINLKQHLLAAPLQQEMTLAEVEIYQQQQLLRRAPIVNHVQLEEQTLFHQGLQWLHDVYHGIQREAKVSL